MKVAYYVHGPPDSDTDTELITTHGPVPREGETVVYRDGIWRVDRVVHVIGDTDAQEVAVSLVAEGKIK